MEHGESVEECRGPSRLGTDGTGWCGQNGSKNGHGTRHENGKNPTGGLLVSAGWNATMDMLLEAIQASLPESAAWRGAAVSGLGKKCSTAVMENMSARALADA